MGWIIVLLQSPATHPLATEDALSLREEGLCQHISILFCAYVCGCGTLLVLEGTLVLAAASNFMQSGNTKLGDSSIDVEALGVVRLVDLMPSWSVWAMLLPSTRVHT
jgi:hypothetical protein